MESIYEMKKNLEDTLCNRNSDDVNSNTIKYVIDLAVFLRIAVDTCHKALLNDDKEVLSQSCDVLEDVVIELRKSLCHKKDEQSVCLGSKEEHDNLERYLYKKVIDLFENEELIKFNDFMKIFNEDDTNEEFMLCVREWLEREFKEYIKKLRELFEILDGGLSLNILFNETKGNPWTAIRRNMISAQSIKEDMKKKKNKYDDITSASDSPTRTKITKKILH